MKSWKKSAISFLAVTLLAVFLAACTPGGRTKISGVLEESGAALALAESLYQRGHSLSSLAIRGGASYTAGGSRHFFHFEFINQKNSFYFTVFDPMGRPAYRITSDGTKVSALDYGHETILVGSLARSSLSLLLPLPLELEEYFALLSGTVMDAPQSALMRENRKGSKVLTELLIRPLKDTYGHVWHLRLERDPVTAEEDLIKSSDLEDSGRPILSIAYDGFKRFTQEDTGEIRFFPTRIKAWWKEKGDRLLELTYDEVRLGFSVPDNVFIMEAPDGFSHVEL